MKKSKQIDLSVPLPQAWTGLFRALGSQRFQDKRADLWYRESTESEYGHRPAWYDVLKSVTILEPYIDSEETLCFKPRLLHMPADIQTRFLQFFYRHCDRVPDCEINTFLSKVVPHLSESSAISSQLKLIQSCVQPVLQETGLFYMWDRTEGWQGNETEMADQVTEKSRDAGKTAEKRNDVTEIVDDDVVIVIDDEDSEPTAKRQRLENYQPVICYDVYTDTEVEDKTDNLLDKAAETVFGDETYNTGTHVTENIQIAVSKNELQLSQVKEQAVEKLKEIWHNAVETSPEEELKSFVSLNSEEMKIAVEKLDLHDMSENSIAIACSHIVRVSELISYNNCICFLNSILCDKVMTLTQNASRALVGAVIMIANAYPKQLIDSVLVPCFKGDFSSPQVDLISRLLKENLNELNQVYFLTKLVECGFEVNDSKIILMQNLIEAVNVNGELLHKILCLFEVHSLDLGKNLKFGKLLLAIGNKHGKMMGSESLAKFSSIVDQHQTFLKKSIENVVKKLKS